MMISSKMIFPMVSDVHSSTYYVLQYRIFFSQSLKPPERKSLYRRKALALTATIRSPPPSLSGGHSVQRGGGIFAPRLLTSFRSVLTTSFFRRYFCAPPLQRSSLIGPTVKRGLKRLLPFLSYYTLCTPGLALASLGWEIARASSLWLLWGISVQKIPETYFHFR